MMSLRSLVMLSLFLGAAATQTSFAATWVSLTMRTECAGKSPEDCLGGLGFNVDGVGHYRVGAAGEGGKEGELKRDEFAEVKRLSDKIAPNVMRSRCIGGGAKEPGSRRQIKMHLARSLERGAGGEVSALSPPYTLVFHWEGQNGISCYAGSVEDARMLDELLRKLMKSYYGDTSLGRHLR